MRFEIDQELTKETGITHWHFVPELTEMEWDEELRLFHKMHDMVPDEMEKVRKICDSQIKRHGIEAILSLGILALCVYRSNVDRSYKKRIKDGIIKYLEPWQTQLMEVIRKSAYKEGDQIDYKNDLTNHQFFWMTNYLGIVYQFNESTRIKSIELFSLLFLSYPDLLFCEEGLEWG